MVGGPGSDLYAVDTLSDLVMEAAGGGDVDQITMALAGYILADHVENLISTLAGASVLTGNAEDNVISSSSGNDRLFGLDGNDILSGQAGTDTLFGGAATRPQKERIAPSTISAGDLRSDMAAAKRWKPAARAGCPLHLRRDDVRPAPSVRGIGVRLADPARPSWRRNGQLRSAARAPAPGPWGRPFPDRSGLRFKLSDATNPRPIRMWRARGRLGRAITGTGRCAGHGP